MSLAWGDLIFPLVPVVFAISSYMPGEEDYIDKQAKRICREKNLGDGTEIYLAKFAKGGVANHNFTDAITSGMLNLLITLYVWPTGVRYAAAVVTTLIFLYYLRRSLYQVFKLDLYQLAADSPPKKGNGNQKKFEQYTYAEQFRTNLSLFNWICAASILIGWCLSQGVLQTYPNIGANPCGSVGGQINQASPASSPSSP